MEDKAAKQKSIRLAYRQNPDNTAAVSLPVYLFKASAWCVAAFAFTRWFSAPVWHLFLPAVLVFAIPVAIAGMYRSTVRKTRMLVVFSRRGWIAKIISGRILAVFSWTVYAVLSTFFMIIGFHFFNTADWILFFAVIPVFYLVFRLFYRFFEKEIRPWLVTDMALSAAVLCTPFLMLAVYAILMHSHEIPVSQYESLRAAISTHERRVPAPGGNTLVKEVSEWMAVYAGIRAYATAHAGQSGYSLPVSACFLLAGYVVLFNAVTVLSACLVPAREIKRIVLPLPADPANIPPEIRAGKGLLYTSVASAALVLLIGTFWLLETRIVNPSFLPDNHPPLRRKVVTYAERIDEVYVKPGTITMIEAYKMDLMQAADASARELEAAVDYAFDEMIVRVDDFLDWYYSLFGEYARIAHWIGGSAENHLAGRLDRHLAADANIDRINDTIAEILSRNGNIEKRLQHAAHALVEKNRIHSDTNEVETTRRRDMSELLHFSDGIGFNVRMFSASAASGSGFPAGVWISKTISGKIAQKAVFRASTRTSARTLARFGASRAAAKSGGAVAGATAGSAAGSVVPGAGTAAGAVIGGVAGAVAGGLAMDKTLLITESHFNRNTLKAEIIAVIEEMRMETHLMVSAE